MAFKKILIGKDMFRGVALCEHFGIDGALCTEIQVNIKGDEPVEFRFTLVGEEKDAEKLTNILNPKVTS